MEGRTLAIASSNTNFDDNSKFPTADPKEREKIAARMREVDSRIEADMIPYNSAQQMDTDEIVTLGELRPWMCALTEMSYQAIGHRRTKNSRIWSMHDLAALTGATP